MSTMTKRIGRLEQSMRPTDESFTNVRLASDGELESYLRSHGINPNSEAELARAAHE